MNDLKVAKKYLSKFQHAQKIGIKFTLSLCAFKNIMRAKRCKYTGIILTEPNNSTLRFSDRTIDRIDHTKGYISGNVCAVCHGANSFKSAFENGSNLLGIKNAKKVLKVLESIKKN